MSKESIIKKRLDKIEKERDSVPQSPKSPARTRVVPVIGRSRRRLNRKFILMLGVWLVALAAALYFMTR